MELINISWVAVIKIAAIPVILHMIMSMMVWKEFKRK